MKRFLYSVGAILALFSLTCVLPGCSPEFTTLRVTKLTVQQIRQRDEVVLKRYGVQVIHLGETVRIVVPSDVLFQPNSANRLGSSTSMLKIIARYIKTYDTVNIKVTAYSAKNIQALTARQAQVVASDLWSRGVDTRLMYTVGKRKQGKIYGRKIEISFRFYPPYISYR